MISYDDFKEGVKTGLFRPKLRQLFPIEMKRLEDYEVSTGFCCGLVMGELAALHFKVRSKRLTRQQLSE